MLLDQAKARQARQAQARPSQGKAQQASQPSQGRLAGRPEFWIFFEFFFGPQNGLELFPRALGGPGGHFPAIFGLFWVPRGPFLFSPSPRFPPISLSWELSLLAALWGAPPVHFTLVALRIREAGGSWRSLIHEHDHARTSLHEYDQCKLHRRCSPQRSSPRRGQ